MKKYINFKNIITAVLALVIIYLVTCKKKVAENVFIPTPAQQLKPVIINEGLSKKAEDSIIKLLNNAQRELKEGEKINENLLQVNIGLQKDMDNYIVRELPDTCKEYQNKMIELNNKLSQSAAKKDADCRNAIRLLQKVSEQKDALIANGKKDYTFLRTSFDTSLSYQKVLLNKKYKPKRSIGALILTEAAWVRPYKFNAGVGLYYRGKNGNQLSVGAMTSQRIILSYSKDLVKF